MLRVDKLEAFHVLYAFHPQLFSLFKALKVSPTKCCKHLHMAFFVLRILTIEVGKDISYAQTIATYLVSVRWSDAFSSRSNLVFALCSLVSTVKNAVSRHDKVGFL